MPLLTSPIDGSPMRQINRYGIEIDVCPTSGGIWLDKGELEKLMAFFKEETMNDQPSFGRGRPKDYDDDYEDYDDDHHHGHRGRREYGGKRQGKMSRIMDIFDF
jgi:Zn-finger nucleic acid-binding protein